MATTTQVQTSTKVRQRAFSFSKLLDWAAILVLGIGAIIMDLAVSVDVLDFAAAPTDLYAAAGLAAD